MTFFEFSKGCRPLDDNLSPKENLIDMASMQHVDYSAKVRFAHFPPGEAVINKQVMRNFPSIYALKSVDFVAIE